MTKYKINKSLLPIKAHYFFFMAALGPILPQLNVYGKELGISPDVMGYITSILPILYILAKPICGFLIDYFTNFRKLIFMLIILIMILCYSGLIFVPKYNHDVRPKNSYNFSTDVVKQCENIPDYYKNNLCQQFRYVNCSLQCDIKNNNTVDNNNNNNYYPGFIRNRNTNNQTLDLCLIPNNDSKLLNIILRNNSMNPECELFCIDTNSTEMSTSNCLYSTITFWSFVILMCLGTIGFNVSNCISDAICFDMLGETQTMKYGGQRVWGTIGFGVTALLGGIAVNALLATTADEEENHSFININSMTPMILIMLFFSTFDMISIKWLKLPNLMGSQTIVKDVLELLQRKHIVIFLIFATLAGILDSFIIYYMFWYLEEVAAVSNEMGSIKLIEGLVVAAECLGGEILFFLISGKILRKIGYVNCLSFCFFMYAIRLGLISLISNPWWLIAIELFMQGPTYALCYTCIVAYASAVSPPGTTATVQGLVAGMDDGLGFAIGSLIGGQLYKRVGGQLSFRIFSVGALITCFLHILIRPRQYNEIPGENVLMDNKKKLPPNELSKLNEGTTAATTSNNSICSS